MTTISLDSSTSNSLQSYKVFSMRFPFEIILFWTNFISCGLPVLGYLPNFLSRHSNIPPPEILKEPIETNFVKDKIYFTGAGIYFWWQAGCAKYLQQNFDLSTVPVYGASAGSLTGALLLNGCDFDKAFEVACDLSHKHDIYSRKNFNGVLGNVLREWIDIVLPENLHERTFRDFHVALTPAKLNVIPRTPRLVSCFSNRKEVIDCLMASCHIPLLLDGEIMTSYKSESYIDGSFWYFITKDRFSGLPLPPIDMKNLFWVDYTDDSAFMKKITGNILEVASLVLRVQS